MVQSALNLLIYHGLRKATVENKLKKLAHTALSFLRDSVRKESNLQNLRRDSAN